MKYFLTAVFLLLYMWFVVLLPPSQSLYEDPVYLQTWSEAHLYFLYQSLLHQQDAAPPLPARSSLHPLLSHEWRGFQHRDRSTAVSCIMATEVRIINAFIWASCEMNRQRRAGPFHSRGFRWSCFDTCCRLLNHDVFCKRFRCDAFKEAN